MQASWRDSSDKCTFIILDKEIFDNAAIGEKEDRDAREILAMVGDTNLFVQQGDDDDDEQKGKSLTGEAEIMIAEPSARGKRLGWEAMCLMLR